jgi:hypothetical protein
MRKSDKRPALRSRIRKCAVRSCATWDAGGRRQQARVDTCAIESASCGPSSSVSARWGPNPRTPARAKKPQPTPAEFEAALDELTKEATRSD